MEIIIPDKKQKDRLLGYIDGEKVNQEKFKNLEEKGVLDDELLIETLNKIHGTAQMIPYISSVVDNVKYKSLISRLTSTIVEPPDDELDYQLPKSEAEFNSLFGQLDRDIQLFNIKDDKRRKEIFEEVKKSVEYSLKSEKVNLNEEQENEFNSILNGINTLNENESNIQDITIINDKMEELISKYNIQASEIWQEYLKNPNNKLIHIRTNRW
jgi:hypothetical protein